MKYSGINRPEVEARDPKVNDLPAMSFGNSLDGVRPVLVLAMMNDLNATSSAPCAIASEPGTWRRACTPVKPPNQANCTWPLVNAVTAARELFTGKYFTGTPSLLWRYSATRVKRSTRRVSSWSGIAVKTKTGLSCEKAAPLNKDIASANVAIARFIDSSLRS